MIIRLTKAFRILLVREETNMKQLTLLFIAIWTALLLASPVYAADIGLSSRCILADAIIAANSDRAEGDCPAGRGADTITLTRDITLDGGLPKITSDITIEGEGYTISGDNRYRIFYNDGGALTIHDLMLIEGRAEGDLIIHRKADGAFRMTPAQPLGGAIANLGELSIVNSSFNDNMAEYSGGAIGNWGELSISGSSFSGNSAEFGGAIANWGELSISDSIFSSNSADKGGGTIGNWDELNISGSSFSGNSAEFGGAIANWGELSISDSSFSHNSASYAGGAIYNWDELNITSSTFIGNSTDGTGGAIGNGGELSISDNSFSHNSADILGGAIYNWGELSIVNSTFSDNSADILGGAIGNVEGELSIVSSTFSGNSAAAEIGDAIFNREEGPLSMVNNIIAGGENVCFSFDELKQNIGNFIQDGSCSPAFSGDPKLGELVEPEDGSPAYFPLLAGSPAIDAADDGYCLETDQIGAVRPQGDGCDIGAIEYTVS